MSGFLKDKLRYPGAMIAVPTATQNIPFVGVRGKYGKINETHRIFMLIMRCVSLHYF